MEFIVEYKKEISIVSHTFLIILTLYGIIKLYRSIIFSTVLQIRVSKFFQLSTHSESQVCIKN